MKLWKWLTGNSGADTAPRKKAKKVVPFVNTEWSKDEIRVSLALKDKKLHMMKNYLENHYEIYKTDGKGNPIENLMCLYTNDLAEIKQLYLKNYA